MQKKGASRKGMRRRQSPAAQSSREDEDFFEIFSLEKESPVKLDVADAAMVKEIARIEPSAEVVAPTDETPRKEGEKAWGQEKPLREHRWVWSFFAGAIAIMFVAIALVNQQSDEVPANGTTLAYQIEVLNENSAPLIPLVSYEKNPYLVQQRCRQILQELARAQKVEEIASLLRNTPTLAASLQRHWKPWVSEPSEEQNGDFFFDVGQVQRRGYLMVQGWCRDSTPFNAFFVEEGERILLDWEATMGVGEAKIETLLRDPTHHPVTMRVVITPSTYYLPALPEADYQSYQLSFVGSDAIVWGFVPRGSLAHQQLSKILPTDAALFEPVTEERVTLRLRRVNELLAQNRFFVTEILHKDWVMP